MRTKPGSMSGASARSKTGTSASCVGLTFSRATRLLDSSSYSTSSTGIEVTLPAPSTSPTPPGLVGSTLGEAGRSAQPRTPSRRARTTPRPVKPDSSRLSTGVSGKTWARRRPPGAASIFTPVSGLAPFASSSSVGRYGVESGEDPVGSAEPVLAAERDGPGSRPFGVAATSAHSAAPLTRCLAGAPQPRALSSVGGPGLRTDPEFLDRGVERVALSCGGTGAGDGGRGRGGRRRPVTRGALLRAGSLSLRRLTETESQASRRLDVGAAQRVARGA